LKSRRLVTTFAALMTALASPLPLLARPAPSCKAAGGVLPAGIRAPQIGNYEEVVRAVLGCPRPTWAAVAGVFPTIEAAAKAAARLAGEPLAPGYPWVVLAGQLQLASASPMDLALVLATFESKDDADAWIAKHASRVENVRIERLSEKGSPPAEKQAIVQIQAGPEVAAFTLEDIEARGAHKRKRERTPACKVPGGALFQFKRADDLFPIGLPARTFSPVRCADGKVAYVPWTSTLNESVVWQDASGRVHVSQVERVECDEPTEILDWIYGSDGRHGPPRRLGKSRHRC
jgi:hypothetical protein